MQHPNWKPLDQTRESDRILDWLYPNAAIFFLGMKTYALRLAPGQDLRRSLEAFARDRPLSAGCILAAVGSLRPAVLRFAGCDAVSEFPGPVELIALSGTLAPNGVHLHGAIADPRGRVRGGHIAPGCLVYTTVELVLGNCPEWRFRRELDPQTGYLELAIEACAEPTQDR